LSSSVGGEAEDSSLDDNCECEGLSIAGLFLNGFTYNKAAGGNKGNNNKN
jgi:hypothetical protein